MGWLDKPLVLINWSKRITASRRWWTGCWYFSWRSPLSY